MSEDKKPIIPDNWQNNWPAEAVDFIEPLIKRIQFAFIERDYEAFMQLWTPGYNSKGSFISLGIRKSGLQENGNRYSILFAFGFFYEASVRWVNEVDGWIDHMADRSIEEYEDMYFNDKWPLNYEGIHPADHTLIANADFSAKKMRPFKDGKRTTKSSLRPTRDAEKYNCDIKQLDAAIQAEQSAETDMWGEPIEREVDPLS